MANIERLLTLGEGQGIDYARLADRGFDTGGKTGHLTWENVHWAMGALPAEQRAIVYLKPNPARVTASELATLTSHLWMSLIGFEAMRRPDGPENPEGAILALLQAAAKARDDRQSRTVRTALAEYADQKLCRSCSGSIHHGKTAQHIDGQGIVYMTCKICNGRTWNPWSDNRRAAAVGGDRVQWRTRYEPGYLHVMNQCQDLYLQGEAAFKRALFGKDDSRRAA